MTPASIVPVTGAWREGDPPGRRQFATLFESRDHVLEAGGRLAPVTVAYETWGTLSPARDNAVLVLHALTGDSHAAGPAGPGHRRDRLVGRDRRARARRSTPTGSSSSVPNVLGGCQGTTGPASIDPDDRPAVRIALPGQSRSATRSWWRPRSPTARHRAVGRGDRRLDGRPARARVGGLVPRPRAARVVVMACGARATAEEIALVLAADPRDRVRPALPRRRLLRRRAGRRTVARHVPRPRHRAGRATGPRQEFDERFGRGRQGDEDPLTAAATRSSRTSSTTARSSPGASTRTPTSLLSRAMNHHDVGRGRGGVARRAGAHHAAT